MIYLYGVYDNYTFRQRHTVCPLQQESQATKDPSIRHDHMMQTDIR